MIKFDEGIEPGTVAWKRFRNERRMRREILRDLIAERNRGERLSEIPPSSSAARFRVFRLILRLFKS